MNFHRSRSSRTITLEIGECSRVAKDEPYTFSHVEKQFIMWIHQWERKIFMCNERIIQANGNRFCCNVDKMKRMEPYIIGYHENDSSVIGLDRFVWTVFANALIEKHKNMSHDHDESNNVCSTKLCLFILLWSSYYLKLSGLHQVQELLREILKCTGNMKFMFSFLPGMSMTSYVSNFVSMTCDEDALCDELFSSIEEDFSSSLSSVSVYQSYSPLIIYFVENMTPLHVQSDVSRNPANKNPCLFTLSSILDAAIVDERHTLLTLAVQHRDETLVKILLQMGASASVKMWDPVLEDFTTAEHLLITSVNSLVASKYFFASLSDGSHPAISSISDRVDSVMVYGNMMRRSLLCPSSRKADNMWRGESWREELNSEIADKWGIGYQRPFPSLQHMTKIVVRQRILETDRMLLPEAILQLPLPNLLKSYLNLLLD